MQASLLFVTSRSIPTYQASSSNGRIVLTSENEKNKRILFVDDDLSILELYEAIFARLPYEIICHSDPLEAVRFLKNEKVDVIISDFSMPKLNGLGLLETIRKKKYHLGCFILVSGKIVDPAEGLTEIFSKPIPFTKLINFIKENA